MSSTTPRELWRPSDALLASSNLTQFHDWLQGRGQGEGITRGDYEALWQWSCSGYGEPFWRASFEYFDVQASYVDGGPFVPEPLPGPFNESVWVGKGVEDATWFPNVALNYAEHIFRHRDDSGAMFITVAEDGDPVMHSWQEIAGEVAGLQAVLAKAGVGYGTRVAGFLPNTEYAVIGFLATAGLGAVWSCCSPEFGAEAVLDRFRQIEPTVLLACRGYRYGGRYRDRTDTLEQLSAGLSSLSLKLLADPSGAEPLDGWRDWNAVPISDSPPRFERVPFDYPLWILYSSGTTGAPKAIVHGHGGCLLEHYKYLSLQADVRQGERFFWYTTTGWMMWNFLQASMLVGAVPVFYDGSPGHPGLMRLWRLAAELPIHHFGTSAPFLHACIRAGLDIGGRVDLSALRSIGSTGAPLSPEGFAYVYEQIKSDVWLTSMSGGTDVCTAFVGGNPWSVVHEGWIQGRALGCDLHAYDESHQPVIGEEGELVVRQPMPSMPVKFWGDDDGSRLRDSYFADIPGVWRHGDWITVATSGEVKIHGRSDATLNRQGVRIGTAELYRFLLQRPEIADALVINYLDDEGMDHMPLFLVMALDATPGEGFRQNLVSALGSTLSPRHVPTRIEIVPDVPYTLSGKRLETPVKRLFEGRAIHAVAKRGSLRNPAALDQFADLAAFSRRPSGGGDA